MKAFFSILLIKERWQPQSAEVRARKQALLVTNFGPRVNSLRSNRGGASKIVRRCANRCYAAAVPRQASETVRLVTLTVAVVLVASVAVTE